MSDTTTNTTPTTTTKKKVKKKKFIEFQQRKFVNLSHKTSDAYIAVHVTNSRWDGYSIRLTDCGEKVTLHGNLTRVDSRKNALHKIDTITETLAELREHLVAEFKRQNLRY